MKHEYSPVPRGCLPEGVQLREMDLVVVFTGTIESKGEKDQVEG
jgi:hypothetical protein